MAEQTSNTKNLETIMAKNSPHILVVDDELSMRELLEYMLTRENYSVSCAQSGREAISMLERDRAEP